MGHLILSMQVTLDGCINPMHGVPDPEIHALAVAEMGKNDGLILGRGTYQMLASYWPGVAAGGTAPESVVALAKALSKTPKYVVSNSLQEVRWENSHLVRGAAAQSVADLKATKERLVVLGSASLAQSLVAAGLIDEFEFLVQPVIAGTGPRLLEGLPALKLELVESRRFASGVVQLRYRPTGR